MSDESATRSVDTSEQANKTKAGIFLGFLKLVVYSCGSWTRFKTFWLAVAQLVGMICHAYWLRAKDRMAPMPGKGFVYMAYAMIFAVLVGIGSTAVYQYHQSVERAATLQAEKDQQRLQDEANAKAQAEQDVKRWLAAQAERDLRRKTTGASEQSIDELLRSQGALGLYGQYKIAQFSGLPTWPTWGGDSESDDTGSPPWEDEWLNMQRLRACRDGLAPGAYGGSTDPCPPKEVIADEPGAQNVSEHPAQTVSEQQKTQLTQGAYERKQVRIAQSRKQVLKRAFERSRRYLRTQFETGAHILSTLKNEW